MTAYAFWNNKGGVGKSFLCFVAASEYASRHPEADVYVIDLCPQANVSETLLGGYAMSPEAMPKLIAQSPRATVGGYLEARLNSPFGRIENVEPFVTNVSEYNPLVPDNVWLVCGDNILEILSEAIRQTSQLVVPTNAWAQVQSWVRDLVGQLASRSSQRDVLFIIDCNPSFAVYTQLALVAADYVVVPFTADDSSRRAIENVVALLYGVGDEDIAVYSRISFSERAREDGIPVPRLHTFVSNRVTLYRGEASSAFQAVTSNIRNTLSGLYKKNRHLFADPSKDPTAAFVEVPDYHSACIVSALTGTPLHRVKAGPHSLGSERVQINKEPLDRYRDSLGKLVDRL